MKSTFFLQVFLNSEGGNLVIRLNALVNVSGFLKLYFSAMVINFSFVCEMSKAAFEILQR